MCVASDDEAFAFESLLCDGRGTSQILRFYIWNGHDGFPPGKIGGDKVL